MPPPSLPPRFGYKAAATAVSVGTSATRLDRGGGGTLPLGNRTGVIVRNMDASKTLYVGFDSAVTTSTGWPVDPGDREQFDFGPGISLFGITTAGTLDARVIEAV